MRAGRKKELRRLHLNSNCRIKRFGKFHERGEANIGGSSFDSSDCRLLRAESLCKLRLTQAASATKTYDVLGNIKTWTAQPS